MRFWTKSDITEKGWDAFVKEMTGIDINSPLIEPAEGDRIDLWKSDFLPVRWKSVEGAITYRFTIKCSWTLPNGKNAVETIYSTLYDIEADRAGPEYTLNIPMTDLERSLLPRYTDLNAWVILTVTK